MKHKEFALGLYEKALPDGLSWAERLSLARKGGYDFMEISIDESDVRLNRLLWSREERLRFIRDVENSGIYVPTMCLSGHRRFPLGSADPALRDRGFEILAQAVEFAVHTGIRVIQLAGYDAAPDEPSTAETREFFFKNLEKGLALAGRRGIILALENVGVSFSDSIAKVMGIISRFSSPFLQAYPDPGNSLAMGNDLTRDFYCAAGRMTALHIKDTKPGIIRRIPFGEGIVDFQQVFELIRRTRYSGMLTVEMWADDRPDAWEETVRAAEFVRMLL